MRTDRGARAQDGIHFSAKTDFKEIVMGLHWDPPQEGTGAADLDALCVLYDAQCRPLEVVHPGHPKNANGSVIHTGDSRTGASVWDDERIFVFLEALPDAVAAVSFVVVSPTGRTFSHVRGASCHVSDHATERECVRLDLTKLDAHTAYCVTTIYRVSGGWTMSGEAPFPQDDLLAELMSRTDYVKADAFRQDRPA